MKRVYNSLDINRIQHLIRIWGFGGICVEINYQEDLSATGLLVDAL